MVAYSHLAGALLNAKFGKITAQGKMLDANEKKLALLESIADVGKLAESGRVKVRNAVKEEAKANNDSEDNVYLEYQVVIGDDEFDVLGVEGDKEECLEQIDEWKQGILEELSVEEQRLQMEADSANAEYAKSQQNEEALKALLTQEIQDYHSYGYQQ